MATTTEIVRQFAAASDVGDAPMFLIATDKHDDRVVDPVIWGDDEQMKRELMAWAKAARQLPRLDDAASQPPACQLIMIHAYRCLAGQLSFDLIHGTNVPESCFFFSSGCCFPKAFSSCPFSSFSLIFLSYLLCRYEIERVARVTRSALMFFLL
ncbi:hypothetical protein ACQ4PT_005908 [Festuca glaucescens]